MQFEFDSLLGGETHSKPDMSEIVEFRYPFEDSASAYALDVAFREDPEAIREAEAEFQAGQVRAVDNETAETTEPAVETAAAAGTTALSASVDQEAVTHEAKTLLDDQDAGDLISNVVYLSSIQPQASDEPPITPDVYGEKPNAA